MGAFVIRQAETLADLEAVRALCWEYRDYLMNQSEEVRQAVSVFYGTADYAAIMDTLHEKHARPTGVILLAEDDGKPVGCGMSQQLSATDAEVLMVKE